MRVADAVKDSVEADEVASVVSAVLLVSVVVEEELPLAPPKIPKAALPLEP